MSYQTVSNVMNGRVKEVSDETRRRVEAAMRELGYHPNAAARGLRSLRTRTFAFLVVDEAESFMADPLTAMVLSGVSDVARDHGYETLLRAERPTSVRSDLLRPVQDGRVDGVLLLLSGPATRRQAYVDELRQFSVPFVVFDELLHNEYDLVVRTDERAAARELTRLLIDAGHRRIGFVAAAMPWPVIEQRYLGFQDAFVEHALQHDVALDRFEGNWRPEGGQVMTASLMRGPTPPSAIVCASDLLALGALTAARELGLAVPEDVAVCGFDDFEFSKHTVPALTTVRVPAYRMGQIAAQMLIDSLAGRAVEPRQVVLASEVVRRQSA